MAKLSDLMAASKATLSASADKGGLPFSEVFCTFEPKECRPEAFDTSFVLTLRELSAGKELEALRAAKGDPLIAGFMQAKVSIYGFNGERIKREELEWLWEALGARGRQKVLSAFAILMGSDEKSDNGADVSRVEDAEGKDE
ncbi:MAG: hypothetical protein HC882_09140 [Acidobacteria bacterium]|nr:hypothetical protein [Acidobacteriota bacterium]